MYKIQEVFNKSYTKYCNHYNPSHVQQKAANSIMSCKSGELGCNLSRCEDCGHLEVHNNSCRNRHCPCCQAVLKELWVDARKSEVIDAPYFHVVFTLPAELNPLIYSNQALLYSMFHKCVSQTLLELSADSKYLGATPGIIGVLHTWGQELNFHPHMHCIITGAGLTKANQLQKCSSNNGFGNAMDYLGRYTHRIAISNGRIKQVTDTHVTFWAKDYRTQKVKDVTITHVEFIRRFLMHVLPRGFQKIRYYGFLNNRYKKKNLKLIACADGLYLCADGIACLSLAGYTCQ